MASVSDLRKRVSSIGIKNDPIWKTGDMATASALTRKELKLRKLKQKTLYAELWDLTNVGCTVEELLNQLVREEGPSVTQTNLLRCAKLFDKAGKKSTSSGDL
ncbi:unnamed protein product [Arabis nemorensis]|uniref:Uncharacterized protein n=1 Tax=Arabis nemorensis TaxID=586526 RepID=A0A565AYE0_9BRAS|nr:unnamed protein product [Arabis nemorensis]